jgi:peptidoglycan L-alanyl-D-glutamate endopeptidase CwlK
MTLNARSEERLKRVHPDLQRVVRRAAELAGNQFIITEGVRTLDRQRELKAAGASKTLNSRHLTGHAVDVAVLVDGEVRWDWPLYEQLAKTVKRAARELRVPITWGGDWPKFRDGPHYELCRQAYPAGRKAA